MGKKYLDTKQSTIEAAVLDVWVDAAEEQKAIRSAARMIVDDTIDEQGFGGLKTSRQQYDEREAKRKERAAAKKKEEEEAKKRAAEKKSADDKKSVNPNLIQWINPLLLHWKNCGPG